MKKTWQDYGREWLDTLVVAISVAMAFRAYFYEPFKIPTGSMQKTLWGYHTEANVEKGTWDAFPLSILKWAWTGSRTVDWKAPVSGTVRCQPRNDGFATVQVGTSAQTWSIPTDACHELHGKFVRAGETFWKAREESLFAPVAVVPVIRERVSFDVTFVRFAMGIFLSACNLDET